MRLIGFPEKSVRINPLCLSFKKRDDSFPPLQKPEIRRCLDHLLQSAGLCCSEFQQSTDQRSSLACDSKLGVFFEIHESTIFI
jgi:hypothetical protein